MKLAVVATTPDVYKPSPVALLSGSLEEKLRKAAEFGCDGVELMPIEPAKIDVAGLRKMLGQHGLEAAAIASGALAGGAGLTLLAADHAVAEQAQERLWQLIELAAAVGAPVVTIGGFRGRLAAVADGHGRDRLIQALQAAAAYAAPRHVRLAIEPLNRYESDNVITCEEGLELLDEIGHAHVGLLIDLFHANIEEPSITESIAQVAAAGRLWHVHLGDSNRLAPGWGHIDFGAVVAALRDVGYTGYLSGELLPQPTPDAAARQTIHFMRQFMPPANKARSP